MEFLECDPSDAGEISGFLHPIWTEVFTPIVCGGADSAEYLFSTWLNPDAIRQYMSEGYVYGYAVIDGERKGVYSYHVLDKGRFYISKVYLCSDVRGKGHGQEMLRMLFDIAKENGCTEVSLNVYSRNKRAIRAYERAGMVKKDLVKSWSHGPYEGYDYVMLKSF